MIRLEDEDVAVVGAGPVGLVTALLLSRRGYRVHVFEARSDPRLGRTSPGRSISFTLTTRGWKTLRAAGVEALVRALAIPLHGRMIHFEHAPPTLQPYGQNGEAIDSVARRDLVIALLNEVSRVPQITVHFEQRCVGADLSSGVLQFERPHGTDRTAVSAPRILATDGANSMVRLALARRRDFVIDRVYSRHFYREIPIPPRAGQYPLESSALHLWPRGDAMLVAFPHLGHGFTATLFMPLEGPVSFNAFAGREQLEEFFAESLADISPLAPNLLEAFYGGAPSALVSLSCYPWVADGRAALVGDAAHPMFPFLGQGLNAGLEDVACLIDRLDARSGDWAVALDEYQKERKPNCDAVTELAAMHYAELAIDARDPSFVLRKRVEAKLTALLPDELPSPYHVVSFSEKPYAEAQRLAKIYRRIVESALRLRGLEHRWGTKELDAKLRSAALKALNGQRRVLRQRRAAKSAR